MDIKPRTFYTRHEDMSPDGQLTLLVEDDGDVIISIRPSEDEPPFGPSQVQFCTSFGGGGASPHTHAALLQLIDAMDKDNRGVPVDYGRVFEVEPDESLKGPNEHR